MPRDDSRTRATSSRAPGAAPIDATAAERLSTPRPFSSGTPDAELVSLPRSPKATSSRPPRWVAALFALDVAFVLVYVVGVLAGQPSPALTRAFDVNGEWNAPTFYSAAQLILLAWALGKAARELAVSRGERFALTIAAALALFLGLDEIAEIHESLGMLTDRLLAGGTRAGTRVDRTGIWMLLLGPPVVALVAWVGWRTAALLARVPAARRLYALGAGTYLGSALVLELASNLARSWPMQAAQHAFEELGEMVGVTLLVWATWELLHAGRSAHHPPAAGAAPH